MSEGGSEAPRTIWARRVYREGRYRADTVLRIGADGRIEGFEEGRSAELELPDAALMPGFVNAHSHAFQRAIRGATGRRPAGTEDHFWTWREAMYRVALELEPDDVYRHSLRAFQEMVRAGFTSVGEFHYLHHERDGRPYPEPNLLARRVVEAARDAGLRITLLNVLYQRGGLRDEPLSPAQIRFAEQDVEAFLERTRALEQAFASEPAVRIGLAAHSVRAVRPEALRRTWEEAEERDWPFHIHLSEQESEVRECRDVHGLTPVALAGELGVLGPGTTAIHCTHVSEAEVEILARAPTGVCACPTTEADLGDGMLPASELRGAGIPISLGSDSQARIDPFEEMRAVEYHERLRTRKRNVLVGAGDGGPEGYVAPELLAMGTGFGARALGLEAGAIAPGSWADLVAIDLGHPILDGWTDETLATHVALSGDPRLVRAVYVGGRRVYDPIRSSRSSRTQ